MSDWTIKNVLEGWIADRTISRRKLAFLKQMHEINVNSEGLPLICPSHISKELDLPNGSTWPYVIADFLDFIEGQKVGHTVTKHKLELGSSGSVRKINDASVVGIGNEDVITVDSVMETWIKKRVITKKQLSFLEYVFEIGLKSLSNHNQPARYYDAEQHWLSHVPMSDEDIREDGNCLEMVPIARLLDHLNPIRTNDKSRIEVVRPLIKELYTPSEDFKLNNF